MEVQKNESRLLVTGVFHHTTDQAAFIDRVDLSVWGKRRAEIKPIVSTEPPFAVGGPKRIFSRALRGSCLVTGNPFQLVYGPMRWVNRVPSAQLLLRSEQRPISFAEAECTVDALIRKGYKCQVSKVEMTFDLSDASVPYIRQHLQTKARHYRQLKDSQGRRTWYAGGPRSPLQIRVYQKAGTVVRLELVFRRAFLLRVGICEPHQLVLLRKVNLALLAHLREVDAAKSERFLGQKRENHRERVVQAWAEMLPPHEFSRTLRDLDIPRPDIFVPCGLELKIRRMQGQLIW